MYDVNVEIYFVFDIEEKNNLKPFLLYTYCRNIYQQGSKLLQT